MANADAYDPRYSKWAYEDLPILPCQWQYSVLPNTKKPGGIDAYQPIRLRAAQRRRIEVVIAGAVRKAIKTLADRGFLHSPDLCAVAVGMLGLSGDYPANAAQVVNNAKVSLGAGVFHSRKQSVLGEPGRRSCAALMERGGNTVKPLSLGS